MYSICTLFHCASGIKGVYPEWAYSDSSRKACSVGRKQHAFSCRAGIGRAGVSLWQGYCRSRWLRVAYTSVDGSALPAIRRRVLLLLPNVVGMHPSPSRSCCSWCVPYLLNANGWDFEHHARYIIPRKKEPFQKLRRKKSFKARFFYTSSS